MEDIYASLSQSSRTLEDVAHDGSAIFGSQGYQQSSVLLGSQEYLEGLRKTQKVVARTSFRRSKAGDGSGRSRTGSGLGGKFECLGATQYTVGESSRTNSRGTSFVPSETSAVGEELRNGEIDGRKLSGASIQMHERWGRKVKTEKSKVIARLVYGRNTGVVIHTSDDSSDELNLTSSSQPIESPRRPSPRSHSGRMLTDSDSDERAIPRSSRSKSKQTTFLTESKPHSSRWRPKGDENSFSDETPEKKKPKIKLRAACNENLDEPSGCASSSRESKVPLSPSRNTKLHEVESGIYSEVTPQPARKLAKGARKLAPFPMAKGKAANKAFAVTKERQKTCPAPFPLSRGADVHRYASHSNDDSSSDGGSENDPLHMNRNDEIINRGGLAPFPMSLKDRPGILRATDFPKRSGSSSCGSGDLALGSNRRESNGLTGITDINESSFTQADDRPDPKTLCPYCDMPFPRNPSPMLLDMLKRIPKYPDARPTNPLGLKAPLLSYVSMCQRHQFEMQLLPKAQAAGWPTYIAFEALPKRIRALRKRLASVLLDKQRSVFWLELKQDIDRQGARKTMGIANQFNSFEKSQPGYYGEQGAVIIFQTLSQLFPPESIDANRTAPLTRLEFIRCVLMPECAVALIQEDLGPGTSIENAIRVLRKSSKYGTSMFPDLDNRDGTNTGETDATGHRVGEALARERARARRIEISEEELARELTRKATKNVSRKGATSGMGTKLQGQPSKEGKKSNAIELGDTPTDADASINTRTCKLRVAKRSNVVNSSSATKPLGSSLKQRQAKAASPSSKPHTRIGSYSKASSFRTSSDSESHESDANEATPRPPARNHKDLFESDSGIVLPGEDSRYEKSEKRGTASSKAQPKLNGTLQPLQAAKSRKVKKEAVFYRTMWENDEGSDESDGLMSTTETDAADKEHKRTSTKTDSHFWLWSDSSTPSATQQS